VTLTTNAIALARYSDQDVRELLSGLAALQVSIGGLDRETYETMYGVAQFHNAENAIRRLLALRDDVRDPASIAFAFRTNDPRFETRWRSQLDGYRSRGIFISHMWTYANYAGLVADDVHTGLLVNANRRRKRRRCAYASVHAAVCWDGRITACSCTDFEGDGLVIGHAATDSLAEVLSGERRRRILDSFEKGKPPKLCQECSAYRPDTDFARPFFKSVVPGAPLPVPFFHWCMT
jgi:MoaA/NifB/PqqE/SkfB family radical SAM enzyme